jgi:hypothetical protein
MGSCECVGNGSNCKCSNIESKINSNINPEGNNLLARHKKWIIPTVSGIALTAYSMFTIPEKNNEKITYDAINNQIRTAESYRKIMDNNQVDLFDKKLKKENIDYYIYALKEDSASIANSFEYKKYEDVLRRNNNAVSLGLGLATIGLFLGIYSVRKNLRSQNSKDKK